MWLSGIIGAVIGGTLADPVKNYPSMFGQNDFLTAHPYFLPNAVCTGIVMLGLTVGFLFLEETHEEKRNQSDIGLNIGRYLLRAIPFLGSKPAEDDDSEEARRLANDEKGDYLAIPTSPQMTASRATSSDEPALPTSEKDEILAQESSPEPKVAFYKSLTKQIKLIIVSYGLLAL